MGSVSHLGPCAVPVPDLVCQPRGGSCLPQRAPLGTVTVIGMVVAPVLPARSSPNGELSNKDKADERGLC